MAVTRAAAAAALFLSACELNTFGLMGGPTSALTGESAGTDGRTDGSTDAATMSDGSTMPTGEPVPEASTLQLSFSQIKQFDFTWSAATGAAYYRLLERLPNEVDYVQLGDDIVGESISLTMPLHFRLGASYILRACNGGGCADSEAVNVVDSMAGAVGYFKASNSGADDHFGARVALSADGNTLIVGAAEEDSKAPGINGDQGNDAAIDAGAVYVFVRMNNAWSQQAYLKASNPGAGDYFGARIAVSADGNTLAAGAYSEDGDVDTDSGAVYVFARVDGAWSQQAYLKASNAGAGDHFGESVAMSADGNTLAIGASLEDSNGIDGEGDKSAPDAGAAYVFVRTETVWSQKAYLKAPNAGQGDFFGSSIALSASGTTLVVGAALEDSDAINVGGDEASDGASNAGAVYVFAWLNESWSKPAYLKAVNTDANDHFGIAVAVSADGNTIAVGANLESSGATGIGGDIADNSTPQAGAVYVFVWANKTWAPQAYIKAPNTDAGDQFGNAVALSANGDILAVGASREASAATGIGGAQDVNTAKDAGAVYLIVRAADDEWSQRAYVKASNSSADDLFGWNVALSPDGNTLAVGAYLEDSASVGVDGNQADISAINAGAMYLY